MIETTLYGKTPLGQLLYDLGSAKLSDRYLARKHGIGIEKIRAYRVAFKRGMKQGEAIARRRRR